MRFQGRINTRWDEGPKLPFKLQKLVQGAGGADDGDGAPTKKAGGRRAPTRKQARKQERLAKKQARVTNQLSRSKRGAIKGTGSGASHEVERANDRPCSAKATVGGVTRRRWK